MFWDRPDTYLFEVDVETSNLRKTIYGIYNEKPTVDTWAWCAHAPTSILHDAMRDQHNNALNYLRNHRLLGLPRPQYLHFASSRVFEVETRVPMVRTTCLKGKNLALNNGHNGAEFLIPRQFGTSRPPGIPGEPRQVNITVQLRDYLQRRQIINVTQTGATQTDETPPVIVAPLSLGDHPAASLGLALFRRQSSSSNWSSVMCTLDPRWAKGKTVIESTKYGGMLLHEYAADRARNIVHTKLLVGDLDELQLAHSWTPPDDGSMSVIDMRPSFFDLLTPVIPSSAVPAYLYNTSAADRTTLEALMELVFSLIGYKGDFGEDRLQIPVMENIISTVVADGLSRSGTAFTQEASRLLGAWEFGNWAVSDETLARTMVRTGEPVESFPRPAFLSAEGSSRMVMRAYFTGYVMAAVGWFDYFCVVVLLLHAVLALGYTLIVVWRKETSEGWDTIPELVALSQKSAPPQGDVLKNTCAGIRTFRTMGKIARVETVPAENGCLTSPGGRFLGGKLQLRFEDNSAREGTSVRVIPGQAYGDHTPISAAAKEGGSDSFVEG